MIHAGFKPALNSKGLRPVQRSLYAAPDISFKPALNSKGLRLQIGTDHEQLELQASPEFKGIKTSS